MKRSFAILFMMLTSTFSHAGICSYVTQDQAELGAKLLQINSSFIKYCASCSEKSKIKVRAEKVEALKVGNEQRWSVFVNEENIDLAYAYLDIGDKNAVNLAKLSGCETPVDIPRMIDSTDARTSSAPEIKPSRSSPPETQPTPLSAPATTPKPQPPTETKPTPVSPPSTTESPQLKAEVPKENLLNDADKAFQNSDFTASVRLYEDLLERHPSRSDELTPKIAKSYYNLGVQTMQKGVSTGNGTKKDCVRAADYIRQSLFLDKNNAMAVEALRIAGVCKELGLDLPKVQDEIDDLKLQK